MPLKISLLPCTGQTTALAATFRPGKSDEQSSASHLTACKAQIFWLLPVFCCCLAMVTTVVFDPEDRGPPLVVGLYRQPSDRLSPAAAGFTLPKTPGVSMMVTRSTHGRDVAVRTKNRFRRQRRARQGRPPQRRSTHCSMPVRCSPSAPFQRSIYSAAGGNPEAITSPSLRRSENRPSSHSRPCRVVTRQAIAPGATGTASVCLHPASVVALDSIFDTEAINKCGPWAYGAVEAKDQKKKQGKRKKERNKTLSGRRLQSCNVGQARFTGTQPARAGFDRYGETGFACARWTALSQPAGATSCEGNAELSLRERSRGHRHDANTARCAC